MEKHKTYIGDAKEVLNLISPKLVDLVITGPPYWNEVVYSNQAGQLSKIDNYSLFLSEIARIWHGCSKSLKPGGILAFWIHDLYRKNEEGLTYIPLHADLIKALPPDIRLRQISIWDRYLSRVRNYFPEKEGIKYQYIIICQKDGEHSSNQDLISQSLLKEFWKPIWYYKTTPKLLGSRLLFKVIFKIISPISDKLKKIKDKGQSLLKDNYHFDEYKTICPPEIAERLIKRFSQSGDIVLDPFLGSGTTMKVADKLGRMCVGIEINPEVISIVQKKIGKDRVEIIF